MAIRYDQNNNTFTHIGVPFNYTRGNPLPLDNSSVWTSKQAAENYAATSPVAYVGQLLTVADPSEKTATVYVISDTDGTLTEVGSRNTTTNAYSKLTKMKDYLYRVEYHDSLDANAAAKHFEKFKPVVEDGCVTVMKGNVVGHNFDTVYSDNAQFIVVTPSTATRKAVIGIACNVPGLTEDFVKSREYSVSYELVPFMLVSGINDAGLVITTNYMPSGDKGVTSGTNPSAPTTVCANMLPRLLLDNFSTVSEVETYVTNLINIYCVEGGELQISALDASGNAVTIEFVNNAVRVISHDTGTNPVITTNFYLSDTSLSLDTDVTASTEGITTYARGLERWNTVRANAGKLNSQVSLMSLLVSNLSITDMYDASGTVNCSDYAGEWDVGGSVIQLATSECVSGSTNYDTVASSESTKFLNRSRDAASENFGTKFTAYSAVFDTAKKTMWLVTQESAVSAGIRVKVSDIKAPVNHSHAFVESWDINSTSSTVDGRHLIPRTFNVTLGDVLVTRQGYASGNMSNATTLYYQNGRWNLSSPEGVAAAIGADHSTEIVLENYPALGDTTVLTRHSSSRDDDRIVTQTELATVLALLGDSFFRFTSDKTFVDGTEYYTKVGYEFVSAIAGVDYTVGNTIPENTYYVKYTEKSLTERVIDLERGGGGGGSATTLEGYGITDAYIDGVSDDEATITLGKTSVAVRTKSYVDTMKLRLDSRVTAYVDDAAPETVVISLGDVPATQQ